MAQKVVHNDGCILFNAESWSYFWNIQRIISLQWRGQLRPLIGFIDPLLYLQKLQKPIKKQKKGTSNIDSKPHLHEANS